MRCFTEFAFLLLALGIATLFNGTANADPGDHINLAAGGLVSSGSQISINLETGEAVKRTAALGIISPTNPWKETRRRLSLAELTEIKRVTKQSLEEGFRSKKCDEEDRVAREQGRGVVFRPPVADAMISGDVQLNGQRGGAPELFCQSSAFINLWTVADKAANGPMP